MSTNLYDPDAELERLYAAITGRPAFTYDPPSDPLYNSYAQSYRRRGRLAMRNTMGQAAALTGGYGSSYAQSVGQQQYDSYLQSLGEALPELYGMAWQRYNAEGDALKTAWELASERSEVKRESEREAAEREAAAQKSAETARMMPGAIGSSTTAAITRTRRSCRTAARRASRRRRCLRSTAAGTRSARRIRIPTAAARVRARRRQRRRSAIPPRNRRVWLRRAETSTR